MAQTNDETFRKVLSKLDLTEDDIEDMPLWNDEEGKQVELLPLLKQIGYLSRLAALDDCELFLKRVQSENPYRNNYGNIMWEKAILKALAELEAMRKKVEG